MIQPNRTPHEGKPWLFSYVDDLRRAIYRLVEPTHSYINNTYLLIPSLYEQLWTAVVAGQQSNAGGGGGSKSRPPFWVDAADLLGDIDLVIAANWTALGLHGNTPTQLHALEAKNWTTSDVWLIRRLTGIIHAWADDIEKLLNYEHHRYLTGAACPVCGTESVEKRDRAGEYIRTPALQISAESGCTCQNELCGHYWAPNKFVDLCQELGMPLPAGVLE